MSVVRLPHQPARAVRRLALILLLPGISVSVHAAEPTSRFSLTARYTLDSTFEQSPDALPVQKEYVSGRVRTVLETPWGELIQSGVSQYDSTAGSTAAWRDEAYWRTTLNRHALTLQVGDLRAGVGLDWTSAYDMTGLQLNRRLGADAADTIEAVLPDVAQLHNVDPATWAWNTVPVVRDTGAATLAAGAGEFSLQAGYLRLNRGSPTTFYGDAPLTSGAIRYGAGPALTVEGYGAATDNMHNAGFGLVRDLGQYGRVGLSGTRNRWGDTQGHQWMATYSGTFGKLRYFAGTQHRTPGYFDLQRTFRQRAGYSGRAPLRHIHTAGLSMPLKHHGQLRMNFVRLVSAGAAPAQSVFHISHASALGRSAWWYTSAYASTDEDTDIGVYVGLRIRLGGGSSTVAYGADGTPASTLRRATTTISGAGRLDFNGNVRLENSLSQSVAEWSGR